MHAFLFDYCVFPGFRHHLDAVLLLHAKVALQFRAEHHFTSRLLKKEGVQDLLAQQSRTRLMRKKSLLSQNPPSHMSQLHPGKSIH